MLAAPAMTEGYLQNYDGGNFDESNAGEDSSLGGSKHSCLYDDEEDYGDEGSPTLFKLSGIEPSLSDLVVEDTLSNLLSIQITLLERNYNGEEGTILFCCCASDDDNVTEGSTQRDNRDNTLLETINNYIQTRTLVGGKSSKMPLLVGNDASVAIVDEEDDEECVEYITEEEAYQLWLEQNQFCGDDEIMKDNGDDNGESQNLVSSPDGILVRPKHRTSRKQCFDSTSTEEEKKCDLDTSNVLLEDKEFATTTPPRVPGVTTTTMRHLKRDPELFEFDNVLRVHYSEVLEYLFNERDNHASRKDSEPTWKENFGSQPILVCGLGQSLSNSDSSTNEATFQDTATRDLFKDLKEFQTALRTAIQQHGTNTIVRTGNRETLVKNGFHNSKPESLGEIATALLQRNDQHCSSHDGESNSESLDGTIIFNPIHEMPPVFRSETLMGRWIGAPAATETSTSEPPRRDFPNRLWNTILNPAKPEEEDDRDALKFTLCMANEGFGIGMHKHGPALFFLTEGRKKWYLSHPALIEDRMASPKPTHPGFYRELSTHKCIQQPGELLLVPNLWYHEIYNLESPTIGIQALAQELPVPGTL